MTSSKIAELFLEANFDPAGPRVERFIDVMEALAPEARVAEPR